MKNKFVLCLTSLIVLSIIGLGEDNWLNQGAALRAEGKYDEALQAFDKATSMVHLSTHMPGLTKARSYGNWANMMMPWKHLKNPLN